MSIQAGWNTAREQGEWHFYIISFQIRSPWRQDTCTKQGTPAEQVALLKHKKPARCLLLTYRKTFSFLLVCLLLSLMSPFSHATVYQDLLALFSVCGPRRAGSLILYIKQRLGLLPSHQPTRQIAPGLPCSRRHPQFFKHCLSRALRWKAKAASFHNSSGERAAYHPLNAMIWDLFTVWPETSTTTGSNKCIPVLQHRALSFTSYVHPFFQQGDQRQRSWLQRSCCEPDEFTRK